MKKMKKFGYSTRKVLTYKISMKISVGHPFAKQEVGILLNRVTRRFEKNAQFSKK
jgi:hypothetical protein